MLPHHRRHTPTRSVTILALAVVVGVVGAFGAALFHVLVTLATTGFYGSGDFTTRLAAISNWLQVLIPAIGGLLVGLIYHLVRVSEAEGEGVPEVVEAFNERKGRIRPIVAPIKIITAAITLGSGGSAGREGPVIQIGSTIGSEIAQLARLDTDARRLLLAAGAAAAIGGTFGAPIAGVLFTIEILRERVRPLVIVTIAIAAIVGTLGMRLLTGYEGLRFLVADTAGPTAVMLLAAAFLGVVAALAAWCFATTLREASRWFRLSPLPRVIQPALGGLLVGLIGLSIPFVHEPLTYPLMMDLLSVTSIPLLALVMLLVAKIGATALTLGSGGSGGIFAPTLLIGTLVGSLFASLLTALSIVTGQETTLVLVGMGAVFAAIAHAPLTAVVILFEMTSGTEALPAILVGALTAYATARAIGLKSVYAEHSV